MIRELTAKEWLTHRVNHGQCRVGPEAVRAIARRVTNEHGFWDFDERKRAHEATDSTPVLSEADA